MKRKIFIVGFLVVFMLFFTLACDSDNKSTGSQHQGNFEDFSELNIPEDFNFETTRQVDLKFYAPNKGTVEIIGNDGKEYYSFLTDDLNPIERTISLPRKVTSLDFHYRSMVFSDRTVASLLNNPEVYLYNIEEIEDEQGKSESKKVKLYVIPILEGIVLEDDGSITSHWGYNNEYDEVYVQEIGAKNKFTGSGLNSSNYDQGQPSEFLPGRHYNVFTVNFTSIGNDCITWSLQTSNRLTQDACPNAPIFPGADQDGDGVLDDHDDYPNDASKAYDIYYPGQDNYGSLAFEDLWPDKGDYDFNDMVVHYNIKEVVNASNELVEIEFDLLLAAIGASRQNGFYFELPIQAQDVTLIQANYPLLTQKTNDTGLAIIQVFNNTNDLIQLNGDYMNTIATDAHIPYIPISFTLEIANEYNTSENVYFAPYNPFITINHDLAMEVHLPGLPATPNADLSYFNNPNNDDATDIAAGYYYKTAEGAPWAINIPFPLLHPLETVDIVDAYPDFGRWVNHNGETFVDWYTNPEIGKVYQGASSK
jgi:LruC domain-containing protein